ncbi:hypothetical protein A3F05_00005 [Candidatus Saccharibacteria bacterium RIFCSPHIGHO2_12_FULL_47_17]|nr:MAG: hypothetical protein A3F05_00005 [Candidatus Saccharibacteria bacterium RIFCSPHIGHO2_12_FULL_47_17]
MKIPFRLPRLSKQHLSTTYHKIRADKKLLIITIIALVAVIGGSGFGIYKLSTNPPPSPTGDVNHDGKVDDLDTRKSEEKSSGRSTNPVKPPADQKPQIYDLRIDNRYLHDFPGEVFGISIPSGKSQVTEPFEIYSQGIDISKCTIKETVVHDYPDNKKETIVLKAISLQNVVLYDGYNTITVSCPSSAGTIEQSLRIPLTDGLPEACRNFAFTDSAVTANNYDDLKNGVIGLWAGCVTTPWVPKYYVTMTLMPYGIYSAVSNEVMDFSEANAMYYGSEADNPYKQYSIKDFQSNRTGTGEIDITWDATSSQTSRGSLKNIKLMGNKLSFEFFHFHQYGPVTFQLYRQ